MQLFIELRECKDMKILNRKKSVALLAIGVSAILFASESKESIEGNFKVYNYNIIKKDETLNTTAVGGFLKYHSDIRYNSYFVFRLDNASPLYRGTSAKKMGFYKENSDNSLTALSEAYLAYSRNGRNLKVGDIMLNTPMMNSDKSRIVSWSYQGVAYSAHLSDSMSMQLNYINKIRSHTSNEYLNKSASGTFNQGITMFALSYEGLDQLSVDSYYYYAPELYNTYVGDASYTHAVNEHYLYYMGAEYFNSHAGGKYSTRYSSNGGNDINLVSLKVGAEHDDWSMGFRYSQNFGESGVVYGYGGLAKVCSSSMVATGKGMYKPEFILFKATYNFEQNRYGSSELACHVGYCDFKEKKGRDFHSLYLHLKQRFDVNTNLFLRYERKDYYVGHDDDHVRAIASYDF